MSNAALALTCTPFVALLLALLVTMKVTSGAKTRDGSFKTVERLQRELRIVNVLYYSLGPVALITSGVLSYAG